MANGGGGEGGGPELAGFFGSGPVGPPVLLTLLAVIVGLGVYYFTFMAGPIARRRRETEPASDGNAGKGAGTGIGPGPAIAIAPAARSEAIAWPVDAALRSAPGGAGHGAAAAAAAGTALPTDIAPDEVGVPRWRRASLQAARKSSSRGPVPDHVAAAFATPAAESAVRRRIGYRLVRVSSIPDELLGEEVARIDRGDEVEVLSSSGAYRLVRLPNGVEGWIHKTTLADEGEFDAVDEGDYPEDL